MFNQLHENIHGVLPPAACNMKPQNEFRDRKEDLSHMPVSNPWKPPRSTSHLGLLSSNCNLGMYHPPSQYLHSKIKSDFAIRNSHPSEPLLPREVKSYERSKYVALVPAIISSHDYLLARRLSDIKMTWRLQTQPRPLYTLPLLLAPPVMYTCAFQGHLGAGSQLGQTRTPSRLRDTWIVTGVELFWICPGVPQTINFKIVTHVIANCGSAETFKIFPSPPRLPSADLQFNICMHDVNWCILRCFSWLEASFAHTAGLAWLTLTFPYFPFFACSSSLACYFLSTTQARVQLICCFVMISFQSTLLR